MSISCKQCGAELGKGNAFCTKCGARCEVSSILAATQRFCTKCGSTLTVETKFCTKCGAANVPQGAAASTGTAGASAAGSDAATGSASQVASSGAPVHSGAGIPKIALIGGGVVVLVIIVAAVAGVMSAAHRAREKGQEMEAAQKFAKSLENLASSGRSDAHTVNNPSAADINKSISELANAANAIAQNAQKQSGANPLNGIADAPSGSTSTPPSASASSSTPPPGSPAAIAAASAAVDAALTPPPLPKPAPIVPAAANGNQPHDWALEYERTEGGPEADLVVRTGDINNLGFGWPRGFDPFSGQSTLVHRWPDTNHIPPQAPPGTDRIMLGTGVMPVHMSIQHGAGQADRIAVTILVKPGLPSDGYSGSLADCFLVRDFEMQLQDPHAPIIIASKEEGEQEVTRYWAPKCTRERALTAPVPIAMSVGALPAKIDAVVFQIFVDDFQPRPMLSHFQVSLNGTRIPSFEYAINSLDQSGPIGKLLTLRLLPEYWPLLKSGTVNLLIDDPTTHVPDGYAIDFARILVNPHKFKYQVSLAANVVDADKHTPIAGATVTAALESAPTDRQGKCELHGIPAGLVVAMASAPGYDESSVAVDLPSGQKGSAEIVLHRHQENAEALEKSIAQTGTATIYGIHFDTGSSKLRADSLPALQAVLALINGRAGSNWIISGHTDNQGSDRLNIPLSKARAASVITWLTAHGVAASRLEPQGFGATRPVADNATANGRFLNRRVEIALAK